MEEEGEVQNKGLSFWRTVLAVEVMDIAFSVDSVLAAFGVSDKVWVLFLGGIIGVLMMRGVAQVFLKLIDKIPELEKTAFILIIIIGLKMIAGAFGVPYFTCSLLLNVIIVIFGGTIVLSLLRKKDKPNQLKNHKDDNNDNPSFTGGLFLKRKREESALRYFNYLTADEEKALFYLPPTSFHNHSHKEILAYSIGAALYMPATRPTFAEDIAFGKIEGLVSVILDLEDAVGENEVHAAEESLVNQMNKLATFIEVGILHTDNLPLLFVRVRSVNQLNYLIERLEDNVALLTGFVFPKFTARQWSGLF